MQLPETSQQEIPCNTLRVTADPEDHDVQAYVGPRNADHPYLHFDGIYEWINEPTHPAALHQPTRTRPIR